MKVDFFIVGAPKAGTTSLYHYLNEHLQIEMSSQKEPDYFSDKAIQDNEQKMIDFLNDVESKGVKIYSVDSSTDIGLRVTGLGGIVSLLRYAIES